MRKQLNENFRDLQDYNQDDYQHQLNRLENSHYDIQDVFFIALGVILTYQDVIDLLSNNTRIVNSRVMAFIIRYLDYMHSTLRDSWKIKFVGFDVTNYNQETQNIDYKELTLLKGQNEMDYFELQSNEFTHLIFFVRYDSQWFAGLFVIETKEIQFYCPSIKIREKVITILNNVLIDEFKVESDKQTDGLKGVTFNEDNQEQDTIVLIQILLEIIRKEQIQLQFLTVELIDRFYNNEYLLDWLLLQTHQQYQEMSFIDNKILHTYLFNDSVNKSKQPSVKQVDPSQKSQTSQKQPTFSKPSFANLTEKTKRLDTREFEDSLMKSMEIRKEQKQTKKQSEEHNDTYARFIRKLQQDEQKKKEDRYKQKLLSKLGDERVEMTKQQFVYMMEKFKEEVQNEIRNEEKQTQASHFISRYLQANNGVVEQEMNKEGQLEQIDLKIQIQISYNVKLTPDQLANLLQRYEEFQQYQEAKQQEQVQMKKQREQMESFNQFQQLLNYYYQTNPAYYQDLLDEYNQRVNQQVLQTMGLSNFQPQTKSNVNKQISKSMNFQGEFNADMLPRQSQIQVQSPNVNLNNTKLSQMSKQSISHSQVSFNQQNKLLDQDQIKASRYDRRVTLTEFIKLQNDLYLTENVFNFFIRYLEEKQKTQPSDTLKVFGQRTFLLTSTFFRNLTSKSLDPNKIQYEAASHYTKSYIGKGQTIFDQFDQIVVPIIITIQEWTVALIKLNKQEVWYYDTIINGDGQRLISRMQNLNQALYMNPNLSCALKFIEMEHSSKLMRTLNIFNWKFKYSGHQKTIDIRQSGLIAGLIIYNICIGESDNIRSNTKEIMAFQNKLMILITEIGMTRNRKKELDKKFNNLPL